MLKLAIAIALGTCTSVQAQHLARCRTPTGFEYWTPAPCASNDEKHVTTGIYDPKKPLAPQIVSAECHYQYGKRYVASLPRLPIGTADKMPDNIPTPNCP